MRIADLLDAAGAAGTVSAWLGRTDGRPVLAYAADTLHYSASTMKLPVVIALMRAVERGALELTQQVRVHNDFASATGTDRFGVRRDEDDAPAVWTRLGEDVELGWLAEDMITMSGNLATDLVLELVGVEATHAVLAEVATGGSAVRRGIDDAPAQRAGVSNQVSAADLAALLVALDADALAAPVSSAHVRDLLAGNRWNDQIPAGLPAGVRVEHKNGWDTGIRHDAGIVRPPDADPFVLAVCTSTDLPGDVAEKLIADVAATAWAHRHDLDTVE